MTDFEKTKEQLIEELSELRRRLATLEAAKETLRETENRVHSLLDSAPLGVADCDVRGILGMNVDITERKRAEEELRASEAKYRRLYASMMDAFASVNIAGFIREFNQVFCQMLGYGRKKSSNFATPTSRRIIGIPCRQKLSRNKF